MRRASLAGISPWETGTWQIRPGEIKLLRPQGQHREVERFEFNSAMKSKPLVPFGNRGLSSEGYIIFFGIAAGFVFGALMFFTII